MLWIVLSAAFAAPPAAEALVYRLNGCDWLEDRRDTSRLLGRTRDADTRDHAGFRDDLAERDAERVALVRPMVDKGRVCTPQDHFDAATVLQRSTSPEDQLLAHVFAFHAFANGVRQAKKLTAVTYDRWLVSRGLPQWYGSQTRTDTQLRTCLIEVDPAATDAHREAAGLPILTDVVKGTQERNGREPIAEGTAALKMNGLYCAPLAWRPEDRPTDPIGAMLLQP